MHLNQPVPYANTYWVRPGQLLAGEHPGDVEDGATEARLLALLAAGVRTFIDLTEEHETDPYALVLRCLAEEQKLEVTSLRIPIPDRGVPSDWTMLCVLDVIDRAMTGERAVFVHCFAGIGRTGTVVGCHLRRHGLATSENVMARIAELRQGIPIACEISPHAPSQVQMVENWND